MENETGAEPLLTTGEALKELHARGLRIDRGTLIRWARAGRIPSDALPSLIRGFHEANRVRSGDPDGLVRGAQRDALLRACADAGVELGDFDRLILGWLGRHEPSTVQVVLGLVTRAYESGRRGGAQ